MAAASMPPRPITTITSSPSHRKPLPTLRRSSLSPERSVDEDASLKPLPTLPLSEGPRLRDAPSSPVTVNWTSERWPLPSNASIENASSSSRDFVLPELPEDRDLPKTPEPPPPPPHSPDYHEPKRPNGVQEPRRISTSAEKPLPPLIDLPQSQPVETVSPGPLDTLPVANAISLDFAFSPSDPLTSPAPDDESSIVSPGGGLRPGDPHRHSRESDTTSSTTQQQASTGSSATTSASSVSGIHETECPDESANGSSESSLIDGNLPADEPVAQFQYHHSPYPERVSSISHEPDVRAASNPDLIESDAAINRHLTPSSQYMRRSSLPRPQSAYSAYSDFGPRGRSPGFLPGGSNIRAPSVSSRRSPETRPSSFAELLNVPYPQQAPLPVSFDNSHLQNAVGNNASLLSTEKTLEMYRQNVKKTNDFSIQYSFAIFLISSAQELGLNLQEKKNGPSPRKGSNSPYAVGSGSSPHELVREARQILQRLANSGYPFAQYYLADGYASGLFSKGKEDYNAAFPLFILAAKHGHAESAYRAALCYEFGWGCRKDPLRAVQFLRVAATKKHPGAMTRLGKACLSGDLGEKKYREGLKWLKLATESADSIYPAAPYHLGCLYETGYGDDIFQDESYAAELFTQAAELGHPDANFRMGDAYEHGKLNCPRDPALSVHFYTGAAERGHAAAMMGLCAWYMVGAEPILEKDEEEAYEWARRSAELGYVKAQYAVGYFTEMGIGCRRDILEANVWYVKAADAGDDRARQRIATINAAIRGGQPIDSTSSRNAKVRKGGEKDDKECVVM